MTVGDGFVTIKNDTGVGRDTRVITPGGEDIRGITSIEVGPISKYELVQVKLTLFTKLDLEKVQAQLKR